MQRDINSYFEGIIENLDIIENSSFYEDKEDLLSIKELVNNWFDDYKKNNTLKGIDVKDLEKIDMEITDYFADYVAKESVEDNYCERLSFDFSRLEEFWKDEMLKSKGGIENE